MTSKKNTESNTTHKTISYIKNTTESLDKKLESNEKLLNEISNTLGTILNERESEETRLLPNNIDNQSKKLDALKNRIISLEDDMSIFQGTLMALEQNLSKAGLANIKQKFDLLQTKIDSNQSGMYNRVKELTESFQQMQEKITSLEIYRNFENQIAEIINRLVFLESRLTAIESILHDIPKHSPIIVE